MTRLFRIYRTFVSSSLSREAEFRANFAAKILKNAIWTMFFYFLIEVIYMNTPDIAGWERGEALILAGIVMFIGCLIDLLFFEIFRMPDHVRKGTLDFILTKPVDAQFWVSLRRFSIDQIGAVAAAVIMVVYGMTQAKAFNPGVLEWLGFFALVVCAAAIYYSIAVTMMTMAIYFVRLDNLWVVATGSLDMARFPLDIYMPPVQRLFTFGIPLAFFGTIPTGVLLGRWPVWWVGVGAVMAFVSLAVSRFFFRRSLRKYSSASS